MPMHSGTNLLHGETFVVLVMLSLAVFYISYTVTRTDGPGDIFLRLRMRLGSYDYGPDGEPTSSAGKLFSCPVCFSFYVAVVIAFMHVFHYVYFDFVIAVFALAGAATLLWLLSE